MSFNETAGVVKLSSYSNIAKMEVKLVCQDCTGQVNITDIMLQGGDMCTAWVAHVSEMIWTVEK